MNNDEKKREEELYKLLIKMENGTALEKSLAFECIGILGNESLDIKLKDKLTIIENMINKYNQKNEQKEDL